ncbi:MAG: hypothetical protein A2386_04870 [Elusimicrobia bacterium RIFOXYB1_FULL_48_9]|nr:MAG: hypothetical protein A2386_04870 [Elusimicrobia bacterium RIFOXYB1_FULL_48_9]
MLENTIIISTIDKRNICVYTIINFTEVRIMVSSKTYINTSLIFFMCVVQAIAAKPVSPVKTNIDFYKIAPDAKTSAVGGDNVALTASLASVISNPAGLAGIYQHKLSLSHIVWTDNTKFGFASYAVPLEHATLALSAGYLGYGDTPGYDNNLKPYSLSSSYETDLVLSYARKFGAGEDSMLGINTKFVNKKLAYFTHEPITMDLGGIWKLPFLSEGLSLGLVYKNAGSTQPQSLVTGFGYHNEGYNDLSVNVNADATSNSMPSYSAGISIAPAHFLRMRAGWRETVNKYESGLRVGLGVEVGNFSVDYALLPYDGVLALHHIGIDIAIGSIFKPQTDPEYHLKRHFTHAKKLFDAKKYVRARAEFEQILALYPDYVPAIDYINRMAQAMKEGSSTDEIGAYLRKADECLANNDFLAARKYYGMVLAAENGNSMAVAGLTRVNELIDGLQSDKARDDNRDVIAKIWEEASVLYARGEYLNAKEVFRGILALDPKHKETLERIVEIDNQLAKINASRVNEMFDSGMDLYNTGKYKEAIRYFEAVVIAAPHRMDAEELVAKCKQRLVDDEARAKRERLAKEQSRMKGEVEGAFARAMSFYEEGDYIKAMEWFNKTDDVASQYEIEEYQDDSKKYIATIKSTLSERHYKFGFNFYQQNRFESAYSEYRKAIQYNPDNSSAKLELDRLAKMLAQNYYERGMSYYTQGDYNKARELFSKSLSYQPDKLEPQRALDRMK